MSDITLIAQNVVQNQTSQRLGPGARTFVASPLTGILYLSSTINFNALHAVRQLHVGDNGVVFDILMVNGNSTLDTTLYTDYLTVFKKPSGGIIKRGGHIDAAGHIRCVLWAIDLNEAGTWSVQPVVTGNGKTSHGSIETFNVLENLI
jgi:hypothetical protein